MTSANTKTKTAAAPEPNDDGAAMLLDLDAMRAAMAAATTPAARMAASRPQAQLIKWDRATVAAAAALPIPIELPTRYPVRGPGAQLKGGSAFVAAPRDLGALDGPTCPERRNDPLITVIRAALLNDWFGRPIYKGASAAAGGILPVSVLLSVIALQPAQQKARKWAQTLTGSGQTNLLAQVANVSARFAVLKPEGITLVQDFYAAD